jgi:uncharacterized iron-regulated membrane protein
MKKQTQRRLHRWLGLIFSLSILAFATSGMLHILMTYTQEPPPPARPSGGFLDPSKIIIPPAAGMKNLPADFGQVRAINLRLIGGEPWYQIYGSGGVPAYISATDGRLDPSQDESYAAEIASAYLGGAAVQKTDYLTTFNREYINIFRVLPVYRFDANDKAGTRVYVSTVTGNVTRHTDDGRQLEANIFSNFHKLAFIPNKQTRDIALTTITVGVILASITGIALFFTTRKH